jgi:predicted nucleic acid-binding protein
MAMQIHVLDASSIVKMCLTRGLKPPQTSTTIDLAKYETFNAILVLSRRGLLKDEEMSRVVSYAEGILSRIKTLSIDVREMREIYKIARQHGLTVYDASYLYIAKKLGGILITEDKELHSKSKQLGVESRTLS